MNAPTIAFLLFLTVLLVAPFSLYSAFHRFAEGHWPWEPYACPSRKGDTSAVDAYIEVLVALLNDPQEVWIARPGKLLNHYASGVVLSLWDKRTEQTEPQRLGSAHISLKAQSRLHKAAKARLKLLRDADAAKLARDSLDAIMKGRKA